jgi:hypothetical protein
MVAVLVLPAPIAIAATHPPKQIAPPGNPAVTEYLEDVPNAMGSAPPGSSSKPSHTLSPSQRRHLDHLGSKGKLLAAVVNETAPPVVEQQTAKPVARPRAGRSVTAAAPPSDRSRRVGVSLPIRKAGRGGSSVLAVLGAATGQGGGGGSGLLLPPLMAVGLLFVILSAVRRRGSR